MPWSGSSFGRTDGTRSGSDVWQQAQAAAVDILASDHDTHDEDLADGIQACLKKDGNNAATGDISWGGNRLTNLGNATAATDALNRQYADARYLQSADVVDDTTPQLGGDLDVNGNDITSTGNANVDINADGTGRVRIGGGGNVEMNVTDDGVQIGSGARITGILDEDDMASNSATDGATQQSIKAYADGKETLGEVRDINTQTGTSYTLVLGDKGQIVEMNNGSANTLTVPPNASVAFPLKSRVDVVQYGAGQTTIAAGSGVTIRAADGLKITDQYAGCTLYKRGTNEWVCIGSLEA